MSTVAANPVDPAVQRLILEQAEAFAQELLSLASDAPDGQVLRLTELFVLEKGREFLRFALQNALQAQANAVEKKGHRVGPVHAVSGVTTKAPPPRSA